MHTRTHPVRRLPLLLAPLLLVLAPMAACQQPAPAPSGAPAVPPARDSAATAAPRDGFQVIPLKDGGRIEGMLRDGKRVGHWASYYADGGIRSRIAYVDGVEQGQTEAFHPSGLTYYSGSYLNGRNFGTWIFYDEEGNELKRVEYDSLGMKVQ